MRTSDAGTPAIRHSRGSKLFGVRKLLFEAGLVDCPPAQRRQGGPATRQGRLAAVTAPEIRATILNYLDARSAVLRPKTIDKPTSALAVFGEFLTDTFPELNSIDELERRHIEAFLTWTSTRSCRGNHGDRTVGPFVTAHAAISVRAFLDDITEWGWPAPARRLAFASDIPKQPTLLPRALAPDADQALMSAVDNLDDPFARVGLTILRGTGLRIGELLELELDAIVDYGPAGSWLRVPLGKLHTERVVPLDAATLDAFDDWFSRRQQQRAIPHPRHGRPVDFVFVENGRHLGPARIQRGLRNAVRAAAINGVDGQPRRIVAHQLRHTYATSLVNAGMTLQALMQLLGHSSPEMTMRYAQLSSPTLRAAYDQAIGKLRRRIPVAPRHQRSSRPQRRRVDPIRNAQDPSRSRPLQPRSHRRSTSLREHLRDLLELHPDRRVHTSDHLATRRHPNPSRRRHRTRLDLRNRPTRTRHHQPRAPPPTTPTKRAPTRNRLTPTPRAG